MTCFRFALLTATLLIATAANAEPKKVTNLNDMKWIVGKWRVETTVLPGEADDLAKPGDRLIIEMDYRQFNDSTYFERVTYTANGKTRNERLNVMAFDPVMKAVSLTVYDTKFRMTGVVEAVNDNQYRLQMSGKSNGGKDVSTVMTWKRLDDDTFTNQFTEFRWGTEALPDTPPDTVKRQR